MDFLEGEFLGPVWVQTDFQDRFHAGAHWLLGFCLTLLSVAYQLIPRLHFLLPFSPWLYLATAILLVICLPFAAGYYQRLPLPLKSLILLAYAFQYLCVWAFPVKMFSQKVSFSAQDMVKFVGELGNRLITTLAEFFSFLGGLAASITGVGLGAVLVLAAVLGVFLLLIFIPLLLFYLVKRFQRTLDWLVLSFLFPERIQRARKPAQRSNPQR